MRVALLYNEVTEDPAYDPWLEEDPVGPVVDAMTRLGHTVRRLACTLDLNAVKAELGVLRPDVVFNRVESLGGSDQMMAAVTLLLDSLRIPCTGCPTEALVTTTGKLSTKQRLRAAGLPTPAWLTSDAAGKRDGDLAAAAGEQVILKAIFEHASFRMDDDAIVPCSDLDAVADEIRRRGARWQRPFFAERFIPGREFNVAILEVDGAPQVLPLAEIDFGSFPAGKPHIVGYQAKWDARSFEYHHTPRDFESVAADGELAGRLTDLSRACWHLFGLRGYARVDFRVDEHGQPWILEVNANPSLAPDAGFAAALSQAGISYDRAIDYILRAALHGSTRPQDRAAL